jgi:anti-sigma B factor antagonist
MDELEAQPGPLGEFSAAADDSGTAIVTISGELDMSNIDALDAEVAPVLEREPTRLIVEVSGLRFADSSAIALWLRWAASVAEFELRNPSPLLRRVIETMGLGERLAPTP